MSAPRILAARTDRLGDVLLTLPVLDYLRNALPEASLDFLCRSEFHEALEPWARGLRVDLRSEIEAPAVYDAALVLFAPAKILFRLWAARVRVRVGLRSKWPGWVFFTDGLVQRRSRGEKPEAVYNLELARLLTECLQGRAPEGKLCRITLAGDEATAAEAVRALKSAGVRGAYAVAHPGMGGSALNLSAEGYVRLLGEWSDRDVVVTTGPSPNDAPMAEAVCRLLPRAKRLPPVRLAVLREVFRGADVVLAPSTGPLHLAHLVGAETVGVFSPIRAQRPERWAPWGGAGRSRVLTPKVACPASRTCWGSRCPEYPCLEALVRGPLPTAGAGGWMVET